MKNQLLPFITVVIVPAFLFAQKNASISFEKWISLKRNDHRG